MNNVYDYDFELTDEDLTVVLGAGGIGTFGLGACGTCGLGGFGLGRFGLGNFGIAPFVSAFSNAVGLNLAFNMNLAAAPAIRTNFLTAMF